MNVEQAISEVLKRVFYTYERREKARRFALRMRAHAARVREEGARTLPGGQPPAIPRRFLNAMCWGVGDEHNRRIIRQYESAAKAAERFCRRRSA